MPNIPMSRAAAAEADTIVQTVAAVTWRDGIAKKCWHIAVRWVPAYAYVLLLFVGLKYFEPDMQSVIFSFGGYTLTWVHVLFFGAFVLTICDLLRVSHPGVENSDEVNIMYITTAAYLILFVAGAALGWRIFSNLDFLLLTLMSALEAAIGNKLNARTAMRGIGAIPSHG